MSAIFELIAIPLGWIMRCIYNLVGNYGITLILFTIVTKLLMMPLTIKQKKSMIRMNAFQPLIQNIQKKYKDDPAKQNEELARLQNEHGFSMTSGCLPLVIQMPILFGLIDVIYKPLRYIMGVSNDVITTLTPVVEKMVGTMSRYSPQTDIIKAVQSNPSAFSGLLEADEISKIQAFDFSFFGLDLTATPTLAFNALLLIPVLVVGSMVVQQVITMKLSGQQTSGGQQFYMLLKSTVMMAYFSFVIPAGVSLYWIFSSLFAIAQEFVLSIFINPEKEKAKIEEEIMEARRLKKEEEKKRKEKQKTVKGDKYVEETIENKDGAEKVRQRLERARAQDREKYGE